MKTVFTHLFRLVPVLGLVVARSLTAQTVTLLCDLPYDYGPPGLILSSNTLYCTTAGNPLGAFGHVGSLFTLNTDGSGFSPLHQFGDPGDGYFPQAGVVLSSNTLYGTTANGGSSGGAYSGSGTVFAINTDGTGYRILYNFTAVSPPSFQNTDGANPRGELALSGNTLYGTARQGGASANGTVFTVDTDGTGFTNLYSFTGPFQSDPYVAVTNSDGALPEAGLVLSGGTLYGTASQGGVGGNGTVFAIRIDGTGFTNLHSFAGLDAATGTNSDGANPSSALILSGDTLYGTAPVGGSSSNGTVFKVNIDGTGFTVLHSFAATTSYNGLGAPINSDGASPQAGLVLWGTTLYGTSSGGGRWGYGTVFTVSTDGHGFKILKAFAGTYGDGANPTSALVLSGDALYGGLGNSENGNNASGVFKLSVPPQLSIIPAGANAVLSWPVRDGGFDYTGYVLQSATNPLAPVWTTNFTALVAVNGQNVVTNPMAGTQQFFRLRR